MHMCMAICMCTDVCACVEARSSCLMYSSVTRLRNPRCTDAAGQPALLTLTLAEQAWTTPQRFLALSFEPMHELAFPSFVTLDWS